MGVLPPVLTVIVYLTDTQNAVHQFLRRRSSNFDASGGIGAVSTRQGIFNSQRVGLGFSLVVSHYSHG